MVYQIGLFILFAAYILTALYRREDRKKISKKEHRLWFLYGLSMFLIDRLPKKIIRKKTAAGKMLKTLYVKENIHQEQYFYLVEKTALCLCVLFLTCGIGTLVSFSEQAQASHKIVSLKRKINKDTDYSFVAEKTNGETENIEVTLQKQELSEEEIRAGLEKKKKKLLQIFLGENQSADHVDMPLNLVTNFGEEDIFVSWELENTTWVDYEGKLADNIPAEGQPVSVSATMTWNNVNTIYEFIIYVYPPKVQNDLQSKIQSYVNEHELNQKNVLLPTKIDGEKITYFELFSKVGPWILPIGLAVAAAVFFLRDQDLKKKMQERNVQMEHDYPEIVSQILLYYGAGLSMKSTFEQIVENYRHEKQNGENQYRYVYEELEMALTKMKSGISEIVAINEFGNRCGQQNYIRLSGIIEQNQRHGTAELKYALKAELNHAMAERKNGALKEGSTISAKLLGPMVLILIIVMIIIMAPAFMSMQFN